MRGTFQPLLVDFLLFFIFFMRHLLLSMEGKGLSGSCTNRES